jgi:hypothetical protein
MKPFKKLEYGFKDISGFKWCQAWIDSYNTQVDSINGWYSNRGHCPEELLNGLHNSYQANLFAVQKIRKNEGVTVNE